MIPAGRVVLDEVAEVEFSVSADPDYQDDIRTGLGELRKRLRRGTPELIANGLNPFSTSVVRNPSRPCVRWRFSKNRNPADAGSFQSIDDSESNR
jgi:hypothetical protein